MEDLGYSIALFVHIVGALGFFVALGLEWTGLSQIRYRSMDGHEGRLWRSDQHQQLHRLPGAPAEHPLPE